MNFWRRHHKSLIILICFFIIGAGGYYYRQPLLYRLSIVLARQTVPFQALVPNHSQKVKTVSYLQINEQSNNVTTLNQRKQDYFKLLNKLNHNNKNDFSFLNNKANEEKLKRVVNSTQHEFIDSYSLKSIGIIGNKNYFVLNVNKKNDSPIITTYQFRIFTKNHNNQIITGSQYLKALTNNYTPIPLYPNITIAHLGLDKANTTLRKMQTAILNAYQPNQPFLAGPTIAHDLKIDDKSAQSIKTYAQFAKGNFKNSGIISYDITDLPYQTKFTIALSNTKVIHYYYLYYDREKNNITSFRQ